MKKVCDIHFPYTKTERFYPSFEFLLSSCR